MSGRRIKRYEAPIRTLVFKVDPIDPDKSILERAGRILREGGLVVFPTETVYGLGANMLDDKAVERLKSVKKRPQDKKFTVHINDLSVISKLGCDIPPRARKLIDKYWPGPLTLVLRAGSGEKIGFRMPKNAVALGIIRESGVPVIAPSANLSGQPAPTDALDALKALDGKIEALVDSGPTDVGIESTVLDMTSEMPSVLREGAIKKSELLKAVDE